MNSLVVKPCSHCESASHGLDEFKARKKKKKKTCPWCDFAKELEKFGVKPKK